MKKSYPKVLSLLLTLTMVLVMMLSGCAAEQPAPPVEAASGTDKVDVSNEEYVWISCLSGFPLFVENDQVGLKKFGEEYGVKVTIAGPSEYDIAGTVKTIEEVIARKPAGIMVLGMESSLTGGINKIVEAGIPCVVVDADISTSKRQAFIGTDWYDVGIAHAEQMVKHTGGKGKVAVVYIKGAENMELALTGYKEYLKAYPDMTVVDAFNSESNPEVAARVTADILAAYPDIAGISGFDGATPGIGTALKEAGKAGKIAVTGMNVDAAQIGLLEEGVFNSLVGQKRQLFTYYGAKLLYDMNHSPATISKDDKALGVTNIPVNINTGIFIVDKDNVKAFKGEK